MTQHNRREMHWSCYELAKEQEKHHMKETLLQVIDENPCPRPKGSDRGRPPEHSKDKMDFACLLMMSDNNTFRGIEGNLKDMRLPWKEPVPDHTTLVRHMQTIPEDWMDLVLAEIARRCMDTAGEAIGPLGADSSGVTTTRYETTGDSELEKQKSRRKKNTGNTIYIRIGTADNRCDS